MIYLEVLYDLLTSGHKVWFVYDAFYAKGEESEEEFEEMVRSGIKLAFEDYPRRFRKRDAERPQSGLTVEEVMAKHKGKD